MSDLRRYQAAIERDVQRHRGLRDIEVEVDAHAELSEDERAALWLYAWVREDEQHEHFGAAHDRELAGAAASD